MKTIRIAFVCCMFLSLTIGEACAYVIPLDQILEKVRKRFAGVNTLIIEQATHVIQSRDPLQEKVFREKIWLKIPRYERTMEMAEPRLPNSDSAYRWLLMASPKGEISAFLSQLGIQIWDLGYDRCEGVVAYRVGGRDPEGPKLLVDKERFFPLLLSYILPGDPEGRLVTVRFRDYRRNDAGWYPHEIEYALEDAPIEAYHVLNLTANAPIQASFFEREIEPSVVSPQLPVTEGKSEDQRLERIMRNLEKKYQ